MWWWSLAVSQNLFGSILGEQDLLTDGPHCKELEAEPLNSKPTLGSSEQTGFLIPVGIALFGHQGCASSVCHVSCHSFM